MKKLIYQNHSEVFERVVRDARGRAFRVRFVVVERGGVLRGRILSCEPVDTLSPFYKGEYPKSASWRTRGRGWCKTAGLLEGIKPPAIHYVAKKLGGIIASPYFNKFSFLTAIKIRAPSFSH